MSDALFIDKSHTISLLVSNKAGVLSRIALVFARRGFNIESLVVSPDLDGKFSRMTITAIGKDSMVEQIIKQLEKLVDVVHAGQHEKGVVIEKEFALIKVNAKEEERTYLLQTIAHFKAETLDFSEDSMVIQITGSTDKLNAFVKMLAKHGIIEMVRTGKVLMARGREVT